MYVYSETLNIQRIGWRFCGAGFRLCNDRPNCLSTDNRLELEQCLLRYREGQGIACLANAVLLSDKVKSCVESAEFLHLNDDTIRTWYKIFQQQGRDTLTLVDSQGGQSRLTSDQEAKLSAWL